VRAGGSTKTIYQLNEGGTAPKRRKRFEVGAKGVSSQNDADKLFVELGDGGRQCLDPAEKEFKGDCEWGNRYMLPPASKMRRLARSPIVSGRALSAFCETSR